MITAEEYKNIKDKLSQINNRISVLQGKKSALLTQLKQILSNYNVSSVTELKELCSKKISEAEKLATDVQDYIQKIEPEIEKAESIL